MGTLAAAGGLAFSFVFNKAHNDKSHNSGKHKADNNRCKILSNPIEHMTFSFRVSVFVKIKSGSCLFRNLPGRCGGNAWRTAVRIVIRVGGNSFVEPYRSIAEYCSTQANVTF